MHVENRVNRAHMLAQRWLEDAGLSIIEERENHLATHILLAELINAIQGLSHSGEKLS